MFFLLKLHLCMGNQSGPHLPHASLGPPESITQTASRLVQPFLHSSRLMAECRRHAPAWPFPKIAPLTGGSGPPSNTCFLRPTRVHTYFKEYLDQFGRLCTAHVRMSSDMSGHALPRQYCPFPQGDLDPHLIRGSFLGSTWFSIPNNISAQPTDVINVEQEGQHLLTGQHVANFRLLANQWAERRLVTQWRHGCRAMRWIVCSAGASNAGRSLSVQISRERSYPLPIYWYHPKGNWLRYNFATDSFYIMKLCSRLFVLYCWNCPKDDKFRYFIPILRKLGAA